MGSVAGEGEVVLGKRGRSDGAEQVRSRCGEEIAGMGRPVGWICWRGEAPAKLPWSVVQCRIGACQAPQLNVMADCGA
jgi:hypothetical protein